MRERKKTQVVNPMNKNDSVENFTLLSDYDFYLFNEGNHFHLYEKMGAHLITNKQNGACFAVWAPNAKSVSVIGSFNQWNKLTHPLFLHKTSGIWYGFIPGINNGDLYKYYIESKYNQYTIDKADPFGFFHQLAPDNASIITELKYSWQDEIWMQNRKHRQNYDSPICIYEMHVGSWRHAAENKNHSLTYREIAPLLVEYIKDMHYTHVEFLPIMEHPFYDSWGYQITGYFAPTARYGKPEDLMFLIDLLHQNEIGVILDWVPSHFPFDAHSLAYFDGTHLYEHSDPRQGFHPDWKSAIFNYGRNEVKSFLFSSAFFWLDQYHIDALRMDAVTSMLRLDYSRKQGEWIPNEWGGYENLEAIKFIQQFNASVYQNYPDIMTIAEESTDWPSVTKPTSENGLGFGYKWDMGWMHDTLNYFKVDPFFRSYQHHQLTFRMMYAFSENFMLPLSHDEVVHLKGSLINNMPGNDNEKFANLRVLLGYMYAQPGKKILFMGNDFAQQSEWNFLTELDWHLLTNIKHQQIQKWVRSLNQIYRNEIALHQYDCTHTGFEWIYCDDKDNNVFTFIRKAVEVEDSIIVIMNCANKHIDHYRIGVPKIGEWKILLHSHDKQFGGDLHATQTIYATENILWNLRDQSISISLEPLSIMFLKLDDKK